MNRSSFSTDCSFGLSFRSGSIEFCLHAHGPSSRSSPIPKRQILDCSKVEEFENDNFEFDENARKFSKRVEKHCGKRRICS